MSNKTTFHFSLFTFHLLRHEIKTELRNKAVLGGIVLYVVSTIFLCYISLKTFNDIHLFNTLFWIITVFSSLNAATKSFHHESSSKQLFIYTLAPPAAVIFSKIIYNVVLIMALTLLSFLLFSVLLDFDYAKVINIPMYLTALLLGSMGLSAVLTLVSAIASKTNNNVGMMAILAFPLLLPLLLTTIEFSLLGLKGFDWSYAGKYIALLGSINVLIITLSFLLFPYLWRE
jgi:heme exporter protein B